MCSLRGAQSIKCLVSKTSFSLLLVSNAWSEREGLFKFPLMIRNHPCQPWEGRRLVGLPAGTTRWLPPLKMQRETTVDDRSSCTVMSVVMCGISLRGGVLPRGACLHSPCSVSSFGAWWGS